MLNIRFTIWLMLMLMFKLSIASTVLDTANKPPLPAKELAQRDHDIQELGRRLFLDPNLSASGKLSCASCHDPAHFFTPANKRTIQLGGENMNLTGFRAAPSLMYLQKTQAFTEHYTESEGPKAGLDDGPAGGFTADGRVDSLREQAIIPLLANHEMANITAENFNARLQKSAEADEFRRLFGADVFSNPQNTLAWAALSLENYQLNAEELHPFTSKYDAFLRHQTTLTKSEHAGLKLFNDPEKGNCASCHQSEINSRGDFPLFTDYGYSAIAVPRNMQIPANQNPEFYDLGLCGPDRKDLQLRNEYCGYFKVPTLRNIATKNTYFHNGAMTSLKKAIEFYVDRDIHPKAWYQKSKRDKFDQYDDLPLMYKANVEKGAPFSRLGNNKPRLNQAEINDVLRFLNSLTDGYKLETK